MALALSAFGVATISSTSAGPGGKPFVNLLSTGNFTSTNGIFITPLDNVKDGFGDIVLFWTRTSNDAIKVQASRQFPAGKSMGFWWLSASQ